MIDAVIAEQDQIIARAAPYREPGYGSLNSD